MEVNIQTFLKSCTQWPAHSSLQQQLFTFVNFLSWLLSFFLLAMAHGLQDLSSLIRDQTQAPGRKPRILTTGLPGKSSSPLVSFQYFFFFPNLSWCIYYINSFTHHPTLIVWAFKVMNFLLGVFYWGFIEIFEMKCPLFLCFQESMSLVFYFFFELSVN